MPVAHRPFGYQRFVNGDEGFALQDSPESEYLIHGPVGDVGDGAFFDFAFGTPRLSEEDGGRGGAIGDDIDVHGLTLASFIFFVNG